MSDTFSQRLKSLRLQANLTVAELAIRANIGRTQVANLEGGNQGGVNGPTLAILLKLCHGLRVELRAFEGVEV